VRRRDVLPLVGALAATGWPFAAGAQQPAMPLVGYLSSQPPTSGVGADTAAGWRAGLAESGFVDGRNVEIIYRWSGEDYERLPALAAELVGRNVAVIYASSLPAALAAKKATATIPIFFGASVDPVAFGLVASLSHPGGNLTGITNMFDQIEEKRLQLLHELVPDAAVIGCLINPNNPNAASRRQHAEAGALALGLQLSMLSAGTAAEIDAAFAAGRQKGIGALYIGPDPLYDVSLEQLAALAVRYRVATIYHKRDFADAGGLAAYGSRQAELSRQGGIYTGRLLKGEKPADLPVVQATKFELVINLKTATAIGLTVPQALLARADEVIE
jgi:putative ABC transport system substrate-binding protein